MYAVYSTRHNAWVTWDTRTQCRSRSADGLWSSWAVPSWCRTSVRRWPKGLSLTALTFAHNLLPLRILHLLHYSYSFLTRPALSFCLHPLGLCVGEAGAEETAWAGRASEVWKKWKKCHCFHWQLVCNPKMVCQLSVSLLTSRPAPAGPGDSKRGNYLTWSSFLAFIVKCVYLNDNTML